MIFDEWVPRYNRLVRTYNKTHNGEQCAAFFDVLQHYSEGVIEQAIAKTIADSKHWPSPAEIRERCAGIIAGNVYTPPECSMCGGNRWIDADDQQHFNLTYTNYVRRCPMCNAGRAESAA
jgi:hypothetical protein